MSLLGALLLTVTSTGGAAAPSAVTSTSSLGGGAVIAAGSGLETTASAVLDAITVKPILEQRTRYQRMMPLSLNDNTADVVSYFDQRLRAGMGVNIGSKVSLHLLADVLPDVIFGDNGSIVGSPTRNRGGFVTTRSPNLSKVRVDKLDPAGDGLDRDNYGFVLAPVDPILVRHLYGEVLLPFGLFRAGRMPLATGRSVLVNEGSRINRWGVSKGADVADAVAFGTSLSAVFDALSGEPVKFDPDRGLFAAVLVGQTVEQQIQLDDDVMQYVGTVWYQTKHEKILGLDIERLKTGLIYAHRAGDLNETYVGSVTFYFEAENDDFRIALHHLQMFGGTREVSESLALLGTSSGPPARQTISAFGGFAEIAAKFHPFELSMEAYWASGDPNPRSNTPINQLTFSEDTNVGLHLFENVVAYQTARSAAMAIANVRAVNPPSYPVAEIDTHGGLQNAVVLFPQVLAFPWPWLSARAGVMFAWSVVPVVDPIGTVLNTDGVEVTDDQLNFNGGKPGNYWGTEIDLGVTLMPVDHFNFDIEAAYLFPGNALQDENGDAVRSLFFTARATIFID